MKALRIAVGASFLLVMGLSTRMSGAGDYRISGPYTHGSLTVFLLHGETTDDGEYLTLDEGLRSGEVVVTEAGEGEVNRLKLENRSGRPLFLQDGDRVRGGKQDRIIGKPRVVPPHSGRIDVESFCIEQGRWTSPDGSVRFRHNKNRSLATSAVRFACNAEGSQSRVWREVATFKRTAGLTTTTSLTEAMDDSTLESRAAPAVAALGGLLDGRPDVVGVAFAIGGDVVEAAVYPNRGLLRKAYARLLLTYAIEATQEGGGVRDATIREVALLLRAPVTRERRSWHEREPEPPGFLGESTGSGVEVNNIDSMASPPLDLRWGSVALVGNDEVPPDAPSPLLPSVEGPATFRETREDGRVVHRQWLRRR